MDGFYFTLKDIYLKGVKREQFGSDYKTDTLPLVFNLINNKSTRFKRIFKELSTTCFCCNLLIKYEDFY